MFHWRQIEIALFRILVPILVLSVSPAAFPISPQGQPYTREGSIGNSETDPCPTEPFARLPVRCWLGERVVFLPRRKALQQYPYRSYKKLNPAAGTQRKKRKTTRTDESASLNGAPYRSLAGRIGIITEIIDGPYLASSTAVIITLEDGGDSYKTGTGIMSSDPHLDSVAFVRDLDEARRRWQGKTLWYHNGKGLTSYDFEKDETLTIGLKNYSPVKVLEIIAGWDDKNPIRFVLEAENGGIGFVDMGLSGTAVSRLFSTQDFTDCFVEADPRKAHDWSPQVWSSIENRKVFVGMTAEQAQMAWGTPESTNRTIVGESRHEQWVYPCGSYIYVTNGIVSGIQN